MLSVFQNLSYKLHRKDCRMSCPSNNVIKSDAKRFLALGGLHEDKLCDTLQAMATTTMSKRFTKSPYSILRATPIDSDCCRLPTASVLSTKADKSRFNQFYQQAPMFLKDSHYAEMRKNEIPRSMVVEAFEVVKPAREPASNCPKPYASLKNSPRILPVRRSLLALVGRNRPWSEISFSLRNLPVRAIESRAQGFNTFMTRRRSSCPPPSPNLVRTHPIERYQAFRECPLPLACHNLPKGNKLELGRGAHLGNIILNQPYHRQPVDCISRGEPDSTPAVKTFAYSHPKTWFRRERGQGRVLPFQVSPRGSTFYPPLFSYTHIGHV